MADYWIKWYHEIIDDPKMATLPDRLWRRFSELCLLAGRLCKDKSGALPDTRQLAWMLRMQTDDLQTDLDQLLSTGLIQSMPNGWFIPNFNKRQSPATSTERVQQYRKRKQREQYNEDVTQLKRKVTQKQINRLTESETETETEKTTTSSCDADFGKLCTEYEKEIGPLSGMISDMLGEDLDKYGLELCIEAIGVAVKNNSRKWSYAHGVLENWWKDGKVGKPKNKIYKATKQEIILPDGTRTEVMA